MKTAVTSLTSSVGIFAKTYQYLQMSKDPQASIDDLKLQWAQEILSRLNIDLKVTGQVSNEKSLMFLGNHISYLDIPLLLSTVRGLSFVAKEEISAWPIFGPAAKKIETVFVKRESGSSRKMARKSIQEALEKGQRVALFPSGTTCLHEKTSWRRGAFEIAHESDLLFQPFRISYSPLRAAAYIDDDIFPIHLYNLFSHECIEAHIEFHEPVKIKDPIEDCERWQNWAKEAVEIPISVS
ncbi:MAG TPA: lysophospholipid acyltransferase family protein, partial [Bdellovibrio sp.]|nr:lysophospholipid acyltransferase family protein [Bdellovibrio sp.]